MSGLTITHLRKAYGEKTVLPDLSLTVTAGELFALLGPNGSGKTTLFRILTTLVTPDAGSVVVAGHDVVRSPAGVRSSIGVVFQSPSLDKKLTVRENLVYGGALYGLRGALLAERIAEVLGAMRLEDRARDLVETLSGGQQRRVEIAKCLLNRPKLLLMDEPSTGLDPAARIDLWALVAQLRAAHGMTVVFTSHLMDECGKADRVGILHEGRLVAVEPPAALLEAAGPSVLRIVGTDLEAVAGAARAIEGTLRTCLLDSEVRIACRDARTLGDTLAARFGDAVASLQISKPTLEDAFLFETGARLNE